MARRDEEKKRRRQKRLAKRKEAQAEALEGPIGGVSSKLARDLRVPPPGQWPGACDPSLARPDLVKFDIADFAMHKQPGKGKCKQFEDNLRKGLAWFLPELDHWAWEAFLYHGAPGDDWCPIEAYLAQAGERFPPAAADQLRLWKQARIGLFEVGTVADDTLGLQEWDSVRQAPVGQPFRVISLNIGGVNNYRGTRGKITLTYVAPWRPEDNLFCAMGYGVMLEKANAPVALAFLDFRHPEVIARPLPWNEGRAAADQWLRAWRQREWHGWLQERLSFPFLAYVPQPPRGVPQIVEVAGLIPTTPEDARHFGIYLHARKGQDAVMAGGTTVTPLDVTSANRLALAEYKAYRDKVGPPPGTRGVPTFGEFRRS